MPQKIPKSRSNFNKILIIKHLQKPQMDVRWKKSESMRQNLAKLDIIGGKKGREGMKKGPHNRFL
ncbi:hypothetical protein B5F83_01790 [Muribaculum sp. An289]|nr:hypothetical protein B5F83_01790 [Muribaculum sp. An289]OUO44296.1 hypothetical protein B5F81_00760 [Muribaculum sp. An287]